MLSVLDHGEIELVDSVGDDFTVVRAARVSHAANRKTGLDPEKDKKLLHYLYRNRHTSPFEHVVFTFRVKAPIFVFRQWHRHRTWSFNEISARYTELPEEFYVPEHIGVRSRTNHQSRDLGCEDAARAAAIRQDIIDACEASFTAYQFLLRNECPREIARSVLPMGTYSEMFATCDLHNLMRFIKDRAAPDAQYEIRVYAEAIKTLIAPIVPWSLEALRD